MVVFTRDEVVVGVVIRDVKRYRLVRIKVTESEEPLIPDEDSHMERTAGCSLEILKRTPQEVQDPVLWALSLFLQPLIVTNSERKLKSFDCEISPGIFISAQYRCGPSEAGHLNNYKKTPF